MSALTKILIVLQLVFSLVVAVLLVLFISKTEDAKSKLADEHTKWVSVSVLQVKDNERANNAESKNTDYERQLTDAKSSLGKEQGEKAVLQAQFGEANARFDTQNTANNAAVASLAATNDSQTSLIKAKDDELARLREQVPSLVKGNGELVRANQELRNQLDAANNSITQYQIMLAKEPKGGSNGAGLGMAPQVVAEGAAPAAAKVNGTVTAVAENAGRLHIELPLGARDGIQIGTKMYVYRGNGYVGDVTVEAVTPDASVAVVVSTKPGETVQKGDMVATVEGR